MAAGSKNPRFFFQTGFHVLWQFGPVDIHQKGLETVKEVQCRVRELAFDTQESLDGTNAFQIGAGVYADLIQSYRTLGADP